MSVRSYISEITQPRFTIFVHVACGVAACVLLWRRCGYYRYYYVEFDAPYYVSHNQEDESQAQTINYYIRQVNGVKLADILFSLLSVCLSVCARTLSPVLNSVCPSHNASATWRIYCSGCANPER